VRDEILGLEHKDWDVEVYGVDPQGLREILDSTGEVDVVGEAFAVYKLGNDLDVSIPRRERKVSVGHRGALGAPELARAEDEISTMRETARGPSDLHLGLAARDALRRVP